MPRPQDQDHDQDKGRAIAIVKAACQHIDGWMLLWLDAGCAQSGCGRGGGGRWMMHDG